MADEEPRTKPNKESLKKAYVPFLAGNGDYVKGVVGLAKGLRKVKSSDPLVVATLPDVPEEHLQILRSQGCIVGEIEPIYAPPNQIRRGLLCHQLFQTSYLENIQVYDKMDHLFDTQDGYLNAVMDCLCEITWSHSAQYKVGYCQQCPNKVAGCPPPLYFNAGMFVFEPNPTYHNLLHTLQLSPPTPFTEQVLLNMFFEERYKPLPLEYNLVMANLWRHPENVDLKKGAKPWRYNDKEANTDREAIKMLVAKWWDIYNDQSLDFKAQDLPLIMASSIYEPRISLVPAPPLLEKKPYKSWCYI